MQYEQIIHAEIGGKIGSGQSWTLRSDRPWL